MPALPFQRSHCPACGKALSLLERHGPDGHCSDVPCRHRRVTARRQAELEAWMRRDRDAAAERAGDPAAAAAPIVVVRWYDTPLVPVPAAQREALQVHLMGLEAEVDALAAAAQAQGPVVDEDPPPVLTPAQQATAAEVDALLGQVCARCTGYCCRLGSPRQAFLDAPTLLEARRRQPGASHADVVAGYLAAVAPMHHAGSCVYHGEHGCTQRRESRAAICNSFECRGLEDTRRHAERDGVRRVYVVRHYEQDGPEGGFAPPYPPA